ncbi:MAG: GDP-mannose 4,6-dehydratase [Planctomycetes bacterium]|nr:GDP-mannose 4,6-dehydratase [Planctomycetota bacterium]
MATLVTGGAGFIGSWLVEALLDRGEEVHALDDFDDFYDPAAKRANLGKALASPRFRLHEADIRDLVACRRLFEAVRFSKVVHLAARAGVRPSVEDPVLYEQVNVLGTLQLLELSRLAGVERFVFASSSSVYGNNEKVPFSEDDPVDRPISPYAATKVAGELLCHTYHHLHGLSVVCLRFFNAHGPRQRPEMAIHSFVRQIEAGEEVTIFGDGSFARDLTYVSDVVEGVLAALDAPAGFEIVNLGSTRPILVREILAVVERKLGKKARVRHLSARPGDVERTWADISKAQRLLGYSPKVSLEEGIERFIRWFRENR